MQQTDYEAIREATSRLMDDINALVSLRVTRDAFMPLAEENLPVVAANMLWRTIVERSQAVGRPLDAPEDNIVIVPEGPQFADENWDDEYEEDEEDEGIPLSDVADGEDKQNPDA